MALFQPYIDKARQEKKALVETLYKKIQLCKHQCDTYYLCIIFKNSGPRYVIATGQPTKTYPTLTLFAITLENPHFYYTKEKCEKLFTNPRSQGCPRFQSGEELANSVGKINA